jgi:hypothetical protein
VDMPLSRSADDQLSAISSALNDATRHQIMRLPRRSTPIIPPAVLSGERTMQTIGGYTAEVAARLGENIQRMLLQDIRVQDLFPRAEDEDDSYYRDRVRYEFLPSTFSRYSVSKDTEKSESAFAHGPTREQLDSTYRV